MSHTKALRDAADWLHEAAIDIREWGCYASEYFQKKWNLDGNVQEYINRAATIRAALAATDTPIAYVTGYHDGRCVIEPLNRAAVLPVGMALYSREQG